MIPFYGSQLTDLEGKPLKGRLKFFKADTTDYETIYRWLSFQQMYVEANNPNYTDINGCLEDNVFIQNHLVSVLQEKYIGDYSDPSSDDRPEMWVADKRYYAGFELESEGASTNVAYGIAGLRNIVPSENMVVTVVGYNNAYDCPSRQYIWKSDSAAVVDNGIVFNSTKDSNGRWFLIPNGDYIPSEYFGVDPSHVSNINALLNYNSNVETFTYPETIKFKRGHYTAPLMQLSTNKNVIVDDQTKFETMQFICGTITVEETRSNRNEYIGNFIPSNDCMIRTSWYKNASVLQYCTTPKTMIVDGFYGTDDLTQDVYVVNDVIIGNISTVSNHLIPLHNVVLKKDNNYSIQTDDGIIAEHYSMTNNVAAVPIADGKVAIFGNNGNSAMSISEELVEVPNLSANGFSATSAYVNGLTATGGYFSTRCTSNMFDGINGRISNFETTAIGSEASAFIYFNHPWRTKAHDSAETWVTQINDGIYGISTDHTNWKFNPVHFNTNYACPIINVAYPVTKDWGFTFYNEAEPGTLASESPTGSPVCVVVANGKNSDDTWNFKKRVVYPGQHVYFHAVTTGSFKEELY